MIIINDYDDDDDDERKITVLSYVRIVAEGLSSIALLITK
jgi:hypothetical protein